jgi:hypothetical protein
MGIALACNFSFAASRESHGLSRSINAAEFVDLMASGKRPEHPIDDLTNGKRQNQQRQCQIKYAICHPDSLPSDHSAASRRAKAAP